MTIKDDHFKFSSFPSIELFSRIRTRTRLIAHYFNFSFMFHYFFVFVTCARLSWLLVAYFAGASEWFCDRFSLVPAQQLEHNGRRPGDAVAVRRSRVALSCPRTEK